MKGIAMPNNESDRSFVCGFVKRPKRLDATLFFTIARQQFVLPASSSYAGVVTEARQKGELLLVLFEKSAKKHPRITGIVPRPTWRQRKAAEEGASLSAVEDLSTEFVEGQERQHA